MLDLTEETQFTDFVRSELEREKRWSRIHLIPLLLAEQDRDLYRREQAALAREKEIMSDVPGWEVGIVSISSFRLPPLKCNRHAAPAGRSELP